MATVDSAFETYDPQRVFEARTLRRALLRNLAKLPERRRELLSLLFLDEVTGYETIGQVLDMPMGSIGPTRQRGLARLRDLLAVDEEWGERQSA